MQQALFSKYTQNPTTLTAPLMPLVQATSSGSQSPGCFLCFWPRPLPSFLTSSQSNPLNHQGISLFWSKPALASHLTRPKPESPEWATLSYCICTPARRLLRCLLVPPVLSLPWLGLCTRCSLCLGCSSPTSCPYGAFPQLLFPSVPFSLRSSLTTLSSIYLSQFRTWNTHIESPLEFSSGSITSILFCLCRGKHYIYIRNHFMEMRS